jgi:thiol-disulfide isomerase/thioredoxin
VLKLKANRPGARLVVVDYSTSWCAPCKAFDPKFKDLRYHSDFITILMKAINNLGHGKITENTCPMPAPHSDKYPTTSFYKCVGDVDPDASG